MHTSTKLLALALACLSLTAQATEVKSAHKAPTANPIVRGAAPAQRMTGDFLYHYLLGEIKANRGHSDEAAATFVDLARKTNDYRLARRALEIALAARQEARAVEAATLWLKLQPKAAEPTQALAVLYLSQGRLKEARPYLERFLQAQKDASGTVFLMLGSLLGKEVAPPAALELIQGLAADHPQLPQARLAVAQAALAAGQHVLALTEVDAALRLSPANELAHQLKGLVLQRSAPKQAVEFYEAYLKAHPKAQEMRLSYTKWLAATNQAERARTHIEQLVKGSPDNAEIHLAAGLLSLQMKDYAAAEQWLRSSLAKRHPDEDVVRLYLGEVEEGRKRPEQALMWYRSVTARQHLIGARLKVANLLAQEGDLVRAREELAGLQGANAEERRVLLLAEARLLRLARQDQEALQILAQALEKDPQDPDVLYEYALTAERLGQLDVFEKSLRRLIQIQPNNPQAYNALGYTLADKGIRLGEAESLIEQAHRMAPEDPLILDSMGWVAYRLGNLPAALEYLQRAWAKQPDPEIAAHLGEVLWKSGRAAEAAALWQQAVQKHPDDEILRKTMERLLPAQ